MIEYRVSVFLEAYLSEAFGRCEEVMDSKNVTGHWVSHDRDAHALTDCSKDILSSSTFFYRVRKTPSHYPYLIRKNQ